MAKEENQMLITLLKDTSISKECRAMDFDVTDRKIISIIYDKDTNRIRSIMLIDYDREVGKGFCQTFHAKRTDRVTTDDIIVPATEIDGAFTELFLDSDSLIWFEDRFEEVC